MAVQGTPNLGKINSKRKSAACQAAVPPEAAFMLACRLDLPAHARFAEPSVCTANPKEGTFPLPYA
jgi:hypothetical protein